MRRSSAPDSPASTSSPPTERHRSSGVRPRTRAPAPGPHASRAASRMSGGASTGRPECRSRGRAPRSECGGGAIPPLVMANALAGAQDPAPSDPAGQQPFALRVDRHGVVMCLADVHTGPDVGHVPLSQLVAHGTRRRPRLRCPTAAIKSRIPIGGRVVVGLRAAKSRKPSSGSIFTPIPEAPRALRSYERPEQAHVKKVGQPLAIAGGREMTDGGCA